MFLPHDSLLFLPSWPNLAEAAVLEPAQYRFESCRGHSWLTTPTGRGRRFKPVTVQVQILGELLIKMLIGSLPQLAEGDGLNPLQSRFESWASH